jgi:hypothetical protein
MPAVAILRPSAARMWLVRNQSEIRFGLRPFARYNWNNKIEKLASVVLTIDLPEHGLKRGDVGTIVLVHRGGQGYEVEFVTLDGETVAVASLSAAQVRGPSGPGKSPTPVRSRPLRKTTPAVSHQSD